MKRKTIKSVFIFLEICFAVIIVIQISKFTLQNFSQTDWVTLFVGLGDSIIGWKTLFIGNTAEKPTITMEIKNNKGSPQIIHGDNGRNIQTKMYVEKQEIKKLENDSDD